jgi:hypothetical protein
VEIHNEYFRKSALSSRFGKIYWLIRRNDTRFGSVVTHMICVCPVISIRVPDLCGVTDMKEKLNY